MPNDDADGTNADADADAAFKALVAALKPFMKARGFKTKGKTFFRTTEDGNTLVVSFQKGTSSTKAEKLFAVNLAVTNARIAALTEESVGRSSATDVWSAHWRSRVQGDRGSELWFRLATSADVDQVMPVLEAKLREALPGLEHLATDDGLLQEWLAGRSAGLVDSQRLLFTALLLKDRGQLHRVQGVVDELRRLVKGRAHEWRVTYDLRKAGLIGD